MDFLAIELTPSGWLKLLLASGILLALLLIRWLKRNPPRIHPAAKRRDRKFRH